MQALNRSRAAATAAVSSCTRVSAARVSITPAAAFSHAAARLNQQKTPTMEDDAKYILKTYARQPLELVKGEGVYVWDATGKKFMDFHSGIAVNSIGHSHPKWVAAVQSQSKELCHVSNLFYSKPQTQLAKQLIEMSKGRFDKVFFCNSGTEANEAALKFVRKYQLVQNEKRTGKSAAARKDNNADRPHEKLGMVAFEQGFHGRSMGALSLTSKWAYRGPFTPLLDSVSFQTYNDESKLDINANTAGVIIEPMQGEGGVHPCKPSFLRKVRDLSTKHDALMIVDEVQCGLGRSGSTFAHQHDFFKTQGMADIEPDMMTLAKPLAGGLPIGAVLMKQKVADCLFPGDHGSTFSGGALVCSAANAVCDILSSPQLTANVSARSTQLISGLKSLQTSLASSNSNIHIVDVRGLGLLVGVELNIPVADVVAAASQRGLMLISAGEKVLRLCPPLIINAEQIDFAIKVITESIQQVASAKK